MRPWHIVASHELIYGLKTGGRTWEIRSSEKIDLFYAHLRASTMGRTEANSAQSECETSKVEWDEVALLAGQQHSVSIYGEKIRVLPEQFSMWKSARLKIRLFDECSSFDDRKRQFMTINFLSIETSEYMLICSGVISRGSKIWGNGSGAKLSYEKRCFCLPYSDRTSLKSRAQTRFPAPPPRVTSQIILFYFSFSARLQF